MGLFRRARSLPPDLWVVVADDLEDVAVLSGPPARGLQRTVLRVTEAEAVVLGLELERAGQQLAAARAAAGLPVAA